MWCFAHSLQVALDRSKASPTEQGRLVQLDFSTAFDRASRCGLLYKLRSIGVGGHFLFIVSEFLSYRGQCVRMDGEVSASVDIVVVLYCTPWSSSNLLETILRAMRIILRSMLLFLDRFRARVWWNRWIRIWQQSIISIWNGIRRQNPWFLTGLGPSHT